MRYGSDAKLLGVPGERVHGIELVEWTNGFVVESPADPSLHQLWRQSVGRETGCFDRANVDRPIHLQEAVDRRPPLFRSRDEDAHDATVIARHVHQLGEVFGDRRRILANERGAIRCKERADVGRDLTGSHSRPG